MLYLCNDMKKHLLYICVGTNLSTADQVLLWVKRKLAEAFRGESYFSTPVKTEPINFPSSDPFTNQIVAVETTVPTKLAIPLLKNLERQLGRTEADVRRGIVRLDLDLLWMDGELLRPEQWELDFVKQGLEELKPQVPQWEQTAEEP